jgi:hypothetical protein
MVWYTFGLEMLDYANFTATRREKSQLITTPSTVAELFET